MCWSWNFGKVAFRFTGAAARVTHTYHNFSFLPDLSFV